MATLKINGDKLLFCNFFKSKIENDRDRVDALECELSEEYSTYSLNSIKGQQNRCEYSAKNGLLNIQLGNTYTELYYVNNIIYGVCGSVSEIFTEADSVGIEEACQIYTDNLLRGGNDCSDEPWYSDWKKGIELTVTFAKEHYKKLTYCGSISNEMWRIMSAEPYTIEQHNLTFDHYHDGFVEVPVTPGDWEITNLYDESSPIYFTLQKI